MSDIKQTFFRKLTLSCGDVLFLALAFQMAWLVRTGHRASFLLSSFEVIALIMYLIAFYIFDLYTMQKKQTDRMAFFLRMGMAVAIVNIPLMSIFYLFNIRPYGAGLLFLSACFAWLFTYGWRLLFHTWLVPHKTVRIAILGSGAGRPFLYSLLAGHANFYVAALLNGDAGQKDNAVTPGVPLLNDLNTMTSKDIISFLKEHSIDMIILAASAPLSSEAYRRLSEIKMAGIDVQELPYFCEKFFGKIPVYHVNDSWFIAEPIWGVRKIAYNEKAKVLADKVMSLFLLLLALPIIICVSLLIKMDSKGPVIYMQKRVGKEGKIFNLYKFRSMRVDAEANGAVWAKENDSRVTRVGRYIRKCRIDEIPQLWNVLKGDMSLVGPRPERPEFEEELIREIPYFFVRHGVSPGITGWAQVNYPYGASIKDTVEKLQYDIYYIKNLSPFLDLLILGKTVRIVLFGRGAR